MKEFLLSILLLQISMLAQAKEYGHYDVVKVLEVNAAPGKSSVTINIVYFEQILDDLGAHAASWPPQFDSMDDRHRAEHDVQGLSTLLDPIADALSHNQAVLIRIALLHAVGHNLEIPGSGEKAIADFTKLLQQFPDDAQANYRYGVFLAGANKMPDAIPYLERAKALGITNADFTLGAIYGAQGEKAKAVEHLKTYLARFPNDTNAARMLDAIQNDKVERKAGAPPGSK